MTSRVVPNATDDDWMKRALHLARRGEALASPNPMVGAVLVREGRPVGEGFHVYDRMRHAEIVALEKAGKEARGATLYVNFEPCCHHGRTGPCTQALISAGVARVVVAMRDPNPRVAGRGLRQLRAAGITVKQAAAFEAEARQLNETFTTWVTAHRPFVTLKTAMTLDGHVVLPPQPNGRQSRWITSRPAREEVHRMRHDNDALLTGIGTVIADDPLLTDRSGLPRRRPLLRVVLDSRLRLPPDSQIVRTADHDVLVFTLASESSPRARALRRAGIEVITVQSRNGNRRPKQNAVDLAQVLAELARRDILSVLLEAGPILNQAALDLGVVDKLRIFYAPLVIGCQPPATPNASATVRELCDVRIERFGPDFAVEGYLRARRRR